MFIVGYPPCVFCPINTFFNSHISFCTRPTCNISTYVTFYYVLEIQYFYLHSIRKSYVFVKLCMRTAFNNVMQFSMNG